MKYGCEKCINKSCSCGACVQNTCYQCTECDKSKCPLHLLAIGSLDSRLSICTDCIDVFTTNPQHRLPFEIFYSFNQPEKLCSGCGISKRSYLSVYAAIDPNGLQFCGECIWTKWCALSSVYRAGLQHTPDNPVMRLDGRWSRLTHMDLWNWQTNYLFASLLLGVQRHEESGYLIQAHQSMVEDMLECWTARDSIDLARLS